ncbi:MAG: tRNA lysidine(34) synthetase TilS [Gemmatimonadota bacterium]
MTPLAERVGALFDALAPADATCLIAVSGGPDSLALLDLLHRSAARHRRPLVVGHIDHGIAAESAAVSSAVANAAATRDLPFRLLRLELGASASETRARDARRAALRSLARDAGATRIVLGHHADDQAETVLLRVLRGSGPAGLAGMAARAGIWLRPLLTISRDELTEHLRLEGLVAWQDPANADPRHLRSWVRGAVLPMLRDRLPDITSRLLSLARQARAARQVANQLSELLESLAFQAESRGFSVAAPPLWGYRSEVRRAVLASLGRRLGVPLGERRLAAVEGLAGKERGRVQLAAGLVAELFDGRLTFHRVWAAPAPQRVESGCNVRIGAAHCVAREATAGVPSRDGWETSLTPGVYQVRAWQRGDRIRPLKGEGSRSVSVLLREARVPPGERPDWPVLTTLDGATIVWVPGICRADACIPEPGTRALNVECTVS